MSVGGVTGEREGDGGGEGRRGGRRAGSGGAWGGEAGGEVAFGSGDGPGKRMALSRWEWSGWGRARLEAARVKVVGSGDGWEWWRWSQEKWGGPGWERSGVEKVWVGASGCGRSEWERSVVGPVQEKMERSGWEQSSLERSGSLEFSEKLVKPRRPPKAAGVSQNVQRVQMCVLHSFWKSKRPNHRHKSTKKPERSPKLGKWLRKEKSAKFWMVLRREVEEGGVRGRRHCWWLFTQFQMKATGRTGVLLKDGQGIQA